VSYLIGKILGYAGTPQPGRRRKPCWGGRWRSGGGCSGVSGGT